MTESRLKENATAFKKLFGTAAKLAQKQAALATLNNVTLPKIYYAIGKKVVGIDKLPPDLAPHREKIRALEARIAARPEEPKAAPAEGFAAKAKHLAQQAAQKASKASSDAAATMQIHAAYVSLGKAAVEKYGDRAIPKDMATEFQDASSRAAELAAEIANLQRTGGLTLSGDTMLALAMYGGAFALPFMDHFGVCVGAQVLWGISWDSWLGLSLALLSHVCLIASLVALAAPSSLPKQAVRSLWLGLAACIALNTAWFLNYRRTFFTGFYLWYTLFPFLAYKVYERARIPVLANAFAHLKMLCQKCSRVSVAALCCFILSWTMPTTTTIDDFAITGWQAFRNALGGSWCGRISAATNLVAIAGLGAVLVTDRLTPTPSRTLLIAVIGSVVANSVWIAFFPHPLFLGFYLWFASFCLLAIAAATQRVAASNAETCSNFHGDRLSRHALTGVLAALLVALPLARGGVLSTLGGMSPRSSDTTAAASPGRSTDDAVLNVAATSETRSHTDSNAGAQALMWMLMGIAAQRQESNWAGGVGNGNGDVQQPRMLCPLCNGTGRTSRKVYAEQMDMPNEPKCPQCRGSGMRRVGF